MHIHKDKFPFEFSIVMHMLPKETSRFKQMHMTVIEGSPAPLESTDDSGLDSLADILDLAEKEV